MHNDDPGTLVDTPLKPINFEKKTDRNSQNLSGKVANIGPKTLHMSMEKRENRVIYASKSRKKILKIHL